VEQQRTSAFRAGRGVTACSDARWGFGIGHEARRAFGTGGGGVSTKAVWRDLRRASLLIFALDKLNVRHISTSALVDLLT